jgi:hypothetical protein
MRISPFHEVSANLISSRIQATNGNSTRLNGAISAFAGDIANLVEQHE